VRVLIEAKADLLVKDPVGNTVLHIACINQNVSSLKVVLESMPEKDLTLELVARNNKGETPYSIAVEHKNDELIKLLDNYQSKVDDVSSKLSKDLLDELEKEEFLAAEEKKKRKEKKLKSKLKKIAEKDGLTVDEIQARH
jgi:ankyrin repeat protein